MARRQKSRSKGKLDESSGDELADTAILYNVPSELARFPSSHSLGTLAGGGEDNTRPKSSRSAKTVGDDSDKPLPPVPLGEPSEEQKQSQETRPALVRKTTNMNATKTRAKRGAKPKISSPVLQETNTSISVQDSSRPTTGHTTHSAFVPQTSTTTAADLSRKISTLMAQAAAQEEQTKSKTDVYNATSVKASPLERGKNAFAKATRAIKERLSNGSIERPPKMKKPFGNRHSSFQEMGPVGPPTTSWQYEILNGLSREKLDRRIAEGENLSNPKIKSLTGDGSIPRKPLPVYESMRSRSMRSNSEDPFLDGRDGQGSLPPQDFSGFNFDLSKQKDKYESKAGEHPNFTLGANRQTEKHSLASNQHPMTPPSTSRFSNLISGLAQHSDTMYFTSSPLSHSTPRARLEPGVDADADSLSRRVLTRSQSAVNSSSEDLCEGVYTGTPSPRRDQARLSNGSSLSVKRKEATADLRSQLSPSPKKIKTDSTGLKEDLKLVAGISDLATGAQRAPLSPKDINTTGNHTLANTSKRKGMSIFDVGRGKGPESKGDDKPLQKVRSRSNHVKRSSVTRPNSSLFGYRRNSRTNIHQPTQADADEMDIDELQSEDAAYQLGGKKR